MLDVKDNKALIITKDIIEQRPYNKKQESVTWETCTLRTYLNDNLFGGFTDFEQSKIQLTEVINEGNQWFGTKGGNTTMDRIFLLSISEVVKYFGDSGQLKNKNPDSKYSINDKYNVTRQTKIIGTDKVGWWWLCSPGLYSHRAAYVGIDGWLYFSGTRVDYVTASGGVRPALWLNLN